MSVSTTTQRCFPTELIEEILNHVNCLPAKDIRSILDHPVEGYKGWRVATLTSCSLVCRAWLPRSRYHLFRSIYILHEDHAHFLQLIASPFCSFIHSIRTIYFRRQHLQETIYGSEDGLPKDHPEDSEAHWLHKALPTLPLSVFTNIQKLRIPDAKFNLMSEEDFMNTLSELSLSTTLTHLALNSCIFSTLDQIIQTLCSCRALNSLSLRYPELKEKPTPEDMLFQFQNATLPTSLSSLMISILEISNIDWILKIMSMVGASLKYLSIHIVPSMITSYDDAIDEVCRAINFDYHPNLESIAFDSLCTSDLWLGMSTRHIPAILQKITSSSIREVVLTLSDSCLSIYDPADLDAIDWASISEVLSQDSYSNLETIHVLKVSYCLYEKAMDIIAERMKGLLTKKNMSIDIVLWDDRETVMMPRFGW
ncbi:uncharacterized protein EV420DRAFT_1765814 [Desarmillaria tabescens]|uniref:F-box domain-containing protein n=1 Tax=Armillaria tabescens TaxID=1929756 RepID=A0AA39K4M8_ARMTA|nr:uncharacterized protein EV420DRAFT_1765814 [Desarmillaria tabescens]KAK0454268.1 hypothetical protein EV420DRAFT_1765814 [Desarmillaria tabescens]